MGVNGERERLMVKKKKKQYKVVGLENWNPGPPHIKGPKPRPRSPIVRDTQ